MEKWLRLQTLEYLAYVYIDLFDVPTIAAAIINLFDFKTEYK